MPQQNSPIKPPRFDELIAALRQSVQKAALQESAGSGTPESDVLVDDEKKTLELEGLKGKLNRIANIHEVRKTYLRRLFVLTVIWLVMVVVFVLMAGFGYRGFKLADSVIIAFITSTTVSVLGLFHFAAKWLFPARRKK
jgi:hypothetical protein